MITKLFNRTNRKGGRTCQNKGHDDNELSVHSQVVDNGGFANPYSGQHGDPTTVMDDVIVDGRIITAENYDAAPLLGRTLAKKILNN